MFEGSTLITLTAFMNTTKQRRHRGLEVLIKEAVIAIVAEQMAQPPVQQPPPAQAAPAQPPAAPTAEPTAPTDPQQEGAPTVDHLIDKLNVIRGGTSFSDPDVYGKLTSYWNGLDDVKKNSVQTALADIGRLVTPAEEANPQQQQGQPSAPVGAPPAAPPAPAAAQGGGGGQMAPISAQPQ